MPAGPGRVTAQRLAGADHAVLTVEGGGHRYRRQPCDTCPWRLDAVGVFPAEAFRHSANTDTDGSMILNVGVDEASHIFGCHASGSRKPATCAGFILRGNGAIGWRLAVLAGKFNRSRVSDGGVALFDSYFDMAVANGVPADDPVLDGCRPWSQCSKGAG